MSIRDKSACDIEPWRTPVLILPQDEFRPFRKALCFPYLKKFLERLKNFPLPSSL